MKIGDRVFVRGHIDEIRKDTVIVRNAGGYFGTIPSEVITGELPSVQPEKRTEKRTETHACDLIDRQAAIDELMVRDKELRNINWYDKPYAEGECRGIDEALAIVSNLPSAQPQPIVRCKDCKYWMPYDWMFSEIWRSQNINDYSEDEIGCQYCDMTMKADDFCSRAERRTDE